MATTTTNTIYTCHMRLFTLTLITICGRLHKTNQKCFQTSLNGHQQIKKLPNIVGFESQKMYLFNKTA